MKPQLEDFIIKISITHPIPCLSTPPTPSTHHSPPLCTPSTHPNIGATPTGAGALGATATELSQSGVVKLPWVNLLVVSVVIGQTPAPSDVTRGDT